MSVLVEYPKLRKVYLQMCFCICLLMTNVARTYEVHPLT